MSQSHEANEYRRRHISAKIRKALTDNPGRWMPSAEIARRIGRMGSNGTVCQYLGEIVENHPEIERTTDQFRHYYRFNPEAVTA